LVIDWPHARIKTELACGQKMKDMRLHVSPLDRVVVGEQLAKFDPTRGHLKQKLFQDAWVHAAQTITVHQPHVIQEWSLEESAFRHKVEGPTLACCKRPADRQLTLDDRPGKPTGGLDLDESLAAIGHLDEEVRHDVA
jgi:hypothetical protein